MKTFLIGLLVVVVFGITIFTVYTFSFTEPQTEDTPLHSEKSIAEKLSLEQRIGQLLMVGFDGKEVTPEVRAMMEQVRPGGVLLLGRNIEDAAQLKILIQELQEISLQESGMLLFVAVDQEGGAISRIPWAEKTPQSELRNAEDAYRVGTERGRDLKELGITVNLAPVLDSTAPRDFLFERSFQKGAEELAKYLIEGQREGGILAAIKHFPGYGGIAFDPEIVELPVLSRIPEISQFQKAMEAKPAMVMTANVVYQDIDAKLPFTFSPRGIRFLQESIQGDYVVISDDLSSKVLREEFSLENSVVLAAKAGVDILIISDRFKRRDPGIAFNALLKAAQSGAISEEQIDKAVSKIIVLKQTHAAR